MYCTSYYTDTLYGSSSKIRVVNGTFVGICQLGHRVMNFDTALFKLAETINSSIKS